MDINIHCEQAARVTAQAASLFGGAQLEAGDIATDYIATTTAAVSVGPVANVPRLDYLGSSCPRLILEPQRQNLVWFSESIDNAYWSKSTNGSATAPSVTANYTTSPDGYQNADRIQLSRTGTTSSDFSIIGTGSINLGSTGTATLYVKSLTSGTQNLLMYWGGGQGGVFSVTTEWTRITLSNLSVTSTALVIGSRGGSGDYFNGGDTTLDIAVWGAQVEAGAYATSYIPTLGAAVTRGADASYKASVSGLIGQTEGTLYAEVQNNSIGSTSGSDNAVLSIEGASNNDIITILYQPTGDIIALVLVGGSIQVLISYNAGVTTSPKKIALAYKANDFAFYVDGVQVGTDTSGTVPTCSNIGLGNYYNGGSIQTINSKIVNQALLFKTRLSNADLAALTA